ncbi:MAG: hypothetical protein ACRCUS_05770, partial [Anaerovoracaceae bacterium]
YGAEIGLIRYEGNPSRINDFESEGWYSTYIYDSNGNVISARPFDKLVFSDLYRVKGDYYHDGHIADNTVPAGFNPLTQFLCENTWGRVIRSAGGLAGAVGNIQEDQMQRIQGDFGYNTNDYNSAFSFATRNRYINDENSVLYGKPLNARYGTFSQGQAGTVYSIGFDNARAGGRAGEETRVKAFIVAPLVKATYNFTPAQLEANFGFAKKSVIIEIPILTSSGSSGTEFRLGLGTPILASGDGAIGDYINTFGINGIKFTQEFKKVDFRLQGEFTFSTNLNASYNIGFKICDYLTTPPATNNLAKLGDTRGVSSSKSNQLIGYNALLSYTGNSSDPFITNGIMFIAENPTNATITIQPTIPNYSKPSYIRIKIGE